VQNSIEIIETSRPIVTIRFSRTPCDEDFGRYLGFLDRNVGQDLVYIIDCRQAGPVAPAHRRLQADWTKQHKEVLRTWRGGVVFLFTSPVVRLAVRSVLILQPLPHPYAVAANFPDALKWARKRLNVTGTPFPEFIADPATHGDLQSTASL